MASLAATLDDQLKKLKELEAKLDRLEPVLMDKLNTQGALDASVAALNTGRSTAEGHEALASSLTKLEQGLDSLEALAMKLSAAYGVALPGPSTGGSLVGQLTSLLQRAEDPRLEESLRKRSKSSSSSTSSSSQGGSDQQRWKKLLQQQDQHLQRLDRLEATLQGGKRPGKGGAGQDPALRAKQEKQLKELQRLEGLFSVLEGKLGLQSPAPPKFQTRAASKTGDSADLAEAAARWSAVEQSLRDLEQKTRALEQKTGGAAPQGKQKGKAAPKESKSGNDGKSPKKSSGNMVLQSFVNVIEGAQELSARMDRLISKLDSQKGAAPQEQKSHIKKRMRCSLCGELSLCPCFQCFQELSLCPCFQAKFQAAKNARALNKQKQPPGNSHRQCSDCLEWFRKSANHTRDGCTCVRAQFAAIKATIAKRNAKEKGQQGSSKGENATLRTGRRDLDSSRSILDNTHSSAVSKQETTGTGSTGGQFYVDTWSETPKSAIPTLAWDETQTSMYSRDQEKKAMESLDAMERQSNNKVAEAAKKEKPKETAAKSTTAKPSKAKVKAASTSAPAQQEKKQKQPSEAQRKEAMEKIKHTKPFFGFSLKKKGMDVENVQEGTPAADAGFKVGMKLVAANQMRLSSSKDFANLARKSVIGDKILCLVEVEGKQQHLVLQVGANGLSKDDVLSIREMADLPVKTDAEVMKAASEPLQGEVAAAPSSPKKSPKKKKAKKQK